MAVQLNHTIVAAKDKHASAHFLADILGLPAPKTFAHFVVVEVDNGVSLDFDDSDDVKPQHYAFLISEEEFDEVFERITERGIEYRPNPWPGNEGEINHHDGGRGMYFSDPNGHLLEVITRPYGSGGG
jgi:catechol 2,3-dioxygenase-like lactoylglutathione lyase family enzyme